MCQNYKTGCCESKINLEDLVHHQRNCIYRQVFCPNMDCGEEGKVLFKDIIAHINICLEEPIEEEKMSNFKANSFLVLIGTNKEIKNEAIWIPTKITTTCGAVFFTHGCVKNQTLYIWICLLGSLDEANKYSCSYSITNRIGEKFIYNSPGPVFTIDKGQDDIIASGSLLMIGLDAAKRSLNGEKQSSSESEGETGSSAGGTGNNYLVFFRNQKECQQMKRLLQQNPGMLNVLLQNIAHSNPELFQIISKNQEAFVHMINESDDELGVEITIRNLNEEAKAEDMESGVSDGE